MQWNNDVLSKLPMKLHIAIMCLVSQFFVNPNSVSHSQEVSFEGKVKMLKGFVSCLKGYCKQDASDFYILVLSEL